MKKKKNYNEIKHYKQEDTTKEKGAAFSFYEILKSSLLSFVIFFIITLPLNDIVLSFKLAFTYLLFMYFPFVFFIQQIPYLSTIERFFLTNLLGLTYSAIYVILDIVLKFPITKLLFFVVAFLTFIISLVFHVKNIKI